MHKVAEKFVKFLLQEQQVSDADVRKYVFGLECFLSDFSKLLLYIAIFASLKMLDAFAIAFVFSAVPRQAAGGWHAKTYWSCFAWTLFGLAVPIFASEYLSLHMFAKLSILVVILTVVAIKAPKDNINKPIVSQKRRRNLKITSFLMFAGFGAVACLLPEKYGQIAILSMAMEGVTLLPND